MTADDVPGPVPRPGGAVCSGCGHARQAHQHYRRGTECSLCSCPRYHRSAKAAIEGTVGGIVRRLRGRTG